MDEEVEKITVKGIFDKENAISGGYVDDETYIASLSEEQKNAIVRNHFDCAMKGGCPCAVDKEYKCDEWQAYCRLYNCDGSDFDFADCMFRSSEHRCLTDYVLWLETRKQKLNE